MLKACTPEQMRAVDKAAWEKFGIPSAVLMENAAIACVRELEKRISGVCGKRIAVICGKGNNGGDGFAAARHLYNMGASVLVILTSGREFAGDCLTNYRIIYNMGLAITEFDRLENPAAILDACDAVVDAVYGTGIRGEVYGVGREAILNMNSHARFVLSVDVPSGINALTGEICGVCAKADVTVTFGAYKTGLLMFPGRDFCGEIVTDMISIPEKLKELEQVAVNVPRDKDIARMLPKRCRNSHKGDYGRVLIAAGSRGMTGAAAMAAQAALHAGAGLITAAVPESVHDIMEQKLTEVMTYPAADEDGHFSLGAAEEILELAQNSDVLLFGPGVGRSDDVRGVLARILEESEIPVIIDADGLYALSQEPELLRESGCNVILTPHTAEFARLAGYDAGYVEENRTEAAKEFAVEYGVTLVLKGHHTIVTACGGTQYINTTGNSGLATGGSGDVLAGMIAAYAAAFARNSDAFSDENAAAAAVYVHGRAAELAACKTGEAAVTPTAVIQNIGAAVLSLEV